MGFNEHTGRNEDLRADKRPEGVRGHIPEILAVLVVLAVVLGIAFAVNSFFFGFDLPGFSRQTSVNVYSVSEDSGAAQTNRTPGSESTDSGSSYEQSKDWRLLLVNSAYPISEDYSIELTELRYGQKVDSRVYPYLQQMFDDMRAEGLSPRVISGYRTREEQQSRVNSRISEYMGYGKSREEAQKLALQWEPAAGASEHELGICVDISSEDEDTASAEKVWEWLDANCASYGFIKRYPTRKASVTGVRGEPWHYRYVGEEAAKEIMSRGITLEEYLGVY